MKKSVITLLIFLIMIISVSAVSAADDASDLVASDDATVSVANTDTAVTADEPKNFAELNQSITVTPGELTLGSDYTRDTTESDSITIAKSINIDGNGSTIDNGGLDIPIFIVQAGKTVTLKNMILTNGAEEAIINYGTLTLDNVTFETPSGVTANGGIVSLSNNKIASGNPIVTINNENAKLDSPSVKVTAEINSGNWKQIDYNVNVYDDKDNLVFIVDALENTWTVEINNAQVTGGSSTTSGGFYGNTQAKSYGNQVIIANNNLLKTPTIKNATVFVTPGVQEVQDSNITLTPSTTEWNDTVTFTVTIDKYHDDELGDLYPTGNVNLTIQGAATAISLELVNGSANYTINNVVVDQYSIKIDYDGDEFFSPASDIIKTLDVTPIEPTINITVDNRTVGSQIITIELPSDATGVINATISNSSGTVREYTNKGLTDGKYTLYTDLSASDELYRIDIVYTPIDTTKYATNTNYTEFYADKFTPEITIAIENTTYGNNVTFTVTTANGVKNFTYEISDESATPVKTGTVNLNNGVASVDVGVIAASANYKVKVTTNATDVYKENSTEVNFKVDGATPVVTITMGDHILFEELEINVTVTVGGTKGDTVIVTDGGNTMDTEQLDENCSATLRYTIDSIGNHQVKVQISTANSNYTDYESEAFVIDVARLTPTITADVGELNIVNIGKNASVNITVKGHNAQVPAGSVTVEFDDFSKVATLDNGNATVNIPASYIDALDYYTITVKYSPSDNYYNPANTTYIFQVDKWEIPIIIQVANFTVKDNITVNVTAGELTTDANPYPAFTKNFTVAIVNLDDEISIKLTNGVPQQLNYTLPAGEYAVEVLYEGDDTHYWAYNMSSVFSVKNVIENLTIVVDNVTYPDQATAVVNASAADGEYIVSIYQGETFKYNKTVTVKDGIGRVTLDLLAPGEYNATVKSLMYDYVPVTNETTFRVKQGTINGTIVIPDVVYKENITAFVTADVDGVYNITYIDQFVANVTVEGGYGRVNFAYALNVGDDYTFKLIAPENDNYTTTEVNRTTFSVSKANITVIVTVPEVNYPEKAIVFINSSAPNTEFRVYVNGTVYYKTVNETGMGNVTIDKLVPNTYDVTVEADGGDNYNDVREFATLIVNKGDIKINVTIPDIYYTNDTYVTGTLDVDPVAYNATLGLGYEITVNNTAIRFYLNGNDTDKNFNLSVILDPGIYTLKVTPKVNEPAFEYYNVNETSIFYTTQFEVKKGLINFNITVLENPVTYPDSVKVNITTNVTGNYLVTVGDSFEKNVFVVANNNTTVDIPGLDVGFYRVTVTSNNDKYYETEFREANFVVYHGSIEARVDIANVNYYTKPVAVVTSTNANGLFTVIVNHKPYNVTVENGTGNVTIDEILNVGNYSAILTADIEYYNPFRNESASFKVLPAPVNLTIEVTTVGYPNQAVATVYANASGSYNITIEGTDYSEVVEITTTPGTIASATYVIPILPVATYNANVTKVDSNPNFEDDVNATTEFNVTKGIPVIIIDIEKTTYTVLDNVTIYITVPYGAYGKVQINDTANATNPIKKDLLLDADGKANFTIVGVKNITTHVIYVELTQPNTNFTSKVNQTSFEVTPIATDLQIEWNKTVVYEDDVEIALNITGLVPGHNPAGRVYIINFTDKAASADEIEFTLSNVAAGDYTLNITYTGDDIYAGCSKLISLTVNKFHPAVNANATGATYPNNATVNFTSNRTGNFSIIVEDAEGTFVKEIPVGIVKNDTVQSVVIDGLAAGNYTAIVVYMPSENYTHSINSTKFEISKSAECTFNADVIDATYPDNATVTAIASEDGAYGIFILENDYIVDMLYGELVANETAIVGLPQLNAGNYILRIFYVSENYTAKDIIKNLTISKGKPVITINVTDATYPEHGIVDITSSADGEYTIAVGTFTATGNFTAGETVTIDLGSLAADTYEVIVVYAENENYNETTIDDYYLTIEKANCEIFLVVDTTEILENATLLVGIPLATGDFVTINGVNVELVDYMGLGEYAEYNIGILKAGVYNFTAVYAGDKNLTAGNETITFTVEKLPSNLVVTVENTTYGTNPIMIVTLDNKENVIVNFVFDDEIEQAGIIKNGSVSGEIVGMAAGDHKVVVTYGGSDIYEAETQTAYYTIDKAPINIEVVVDDVVYPSPITVTVKADVAGTYTVKLGTTTEEITLEADVAQDLIFVKPAGTYDVTVSRAESENYTNASVSTEVTLEKGDVNINITVPDVTYPEDIVVTIVADVAGDYTVKLEDITQLVTLEPGVAKDVKFFGLNAGDYLVIAAYEETQNYTGAVEVEEVTVDKAVVNLVVEGDDVTYPEDAYVTVSTDLTGVYTLEITGISIENVTLNAGTPVKFIVPYYNAGIYEAIVTYAGSENYYPALDYDYVIVDKADVNMSITSSDVTYPDDVVVTVVSDVAGTYYVYLDVTSPKVVALEPGVPRDVIFSDLDAGTYEFTLAYLETENFNAAVESINVTVNKVENTTITVEATSPSLGENATITVTLPADATGTVDVKYGNGVYSAPVVDGVAVVSVPTTVVGTDTATVQYSGDTNYAPASGSVDITVLPQGIIIAENIRRGVNSPYDYYATLVDAGGNPIEGVEITFTIAGNTFKAVTNASGVATIFAGLEVIDGKDTPYAVVVTNPYTLENVTATTTIVPRLIVVSGDLTADYLENPPYIVQAIGDDGNPVGANVTVRIVFAGFYYDMQTNATGHVARTIALAPGSYAVRGEYAGYKTEQTAFRVLQILKASSGTLKKTAKSYTLKATLKHTNGRVISGAVVKLNFNGKTYTVKTNAKGVASYTLKSSQIKKLTAGKTYVLKALYVNDWTKGQWQGKIKVVNK